MEFNFPSPNKSTILALGAESAGNFSLYKNGTIYFSEDFGDLLEENNWRNYRANILKYLKENKLKPDVLLTDLHPLFFTTQFGADLAQKYKARHIQIEHHLAHVFSAIGDKLEQDTRYKIQDTICGIAADGTGYGADEKIWGGEVFKISKLETRNSKLKIERIGHLEKQPLIGGDLAIREPARMLIGILSKFLDKKELYNFVKKYYSRNVFELLYSQLQQNFNCQETSSAGRVLDAASLLLGFCGNIRNYKHEPIDLLEKNSTEPYHDLKPILINSLKNSELIRNSKLKIQNSDPQFILQTAPLFKYLVKNINKNHSRLAATAQLYLGEGLFEILKAKSYKLRPVFFAGGIANNKITSSYLESKGAYASKKIPRGDAGLSFGQVVYYLLS